MIPFLPCETARELLEPFVDGELSMADQVAVQTHLRSCGTCAAHVEDLSLIGWSVRSGAPVTSSGLDDAGALAVIQSGVLTRIRAERAQSLRSRLPELFADMRLLWPALGATAAVLICLTGAVNIWQLTTERGPNSLAAMIDRAGSPGSDKNPLRLYHWLSVPRVLDEGFALDRISKEEAVFAVAAVVTTAGRVGGAEMLPSPGLARAASDSEVAAVLSAFRESRFAPAQGPGGQPVAVRAVFIFAQTTVKESGAAKGSARELDYVVPTARRAPLPRDPQKEIVPGAPSTRSAVIQASATA